ncbi:MAG: SDR family oxidoreductase [Hyphomicrobiaceae bacterium]|nr:SDR family oxidoreductase [Hyphomicrobiaceae bacterium]
MLTDKIVLLTGAGGLLGQAVAAMMEREGATLALIDLHREKLDRVRSTLRCQDHRAFECDVSDCDRFQSLLESIVSEIGCPDVLVNCHGVIASKLLVDMELSEWRRVFEANVFGTLVTSRAVARLWIERGREGVIVNLSSMSVRSPRAGASHYGASKAAVENMTQTWAAELGRNGIRVNAVAPGLIMDEVITEADAASDGYVADTLQATPLGRTGSASDVAEAIVFLASDRAAWLSGTVVDVTGGAHCGRTHMRIASAPDAR